MEASAVFEECFNNIIANKYKDSYYQFAENYYKYPDQINILSGVIISHMLLNTVEECCHFLQTEAPVSPLSHKISLLLSFIKRNNYFTGRDPHEIIFNLGLFLKNNNFHADAQAYFRTCQVLKPNNPKTLAMLGEAEVIKNNIAKGIRLFAQAATGK